MVNAPAGEVDENEDDTTEADSDCFPESQTAIQHPIEATQNSLPEVSDRRSTFTFTMDAPTVEDLPDYESLDGHDQFEQQPDSPPTEDATIVNLFRSPVKGAAMDFAGSPEKVSYPELPQSDDGETTTETVSQLVAATEENECVDKDGIVHDTVNQVVETSETTVEPQSGSEPFQNNQFHHEQSPTTQETPAFSTEVVYPTLPTSNSETSMPLTPQDSNDECEDTEMSDISLNLYSEEDATDNNNLNAEVIPSSDEEFTEASLQLNIQREYEQTRQEEHPVPMDGQDQQVNGELEVQEVGTPEADDPIDRPDFRDDLAQSQAEALQTPYAEDNEVCSAATESMEAAQLLQSPPIQYLNPADAPVIDIADGLTLGFTPAKVPSANPTPRKLHSPPPPPRSESGPDDVTMTIAIDDDTAILKDFLSRAAANKAEKAANVTHRRESIQNRRDSDVVRHALASPRKILEEKDPNSPSKHDVELTLDLSQTLTLSIPDDTLASPTPDQAYSEGTETEKSLRGSRRSSRTKKSRLPALASAAQAQAQASKIAIRRADGNEVVVLKKNDVQELAALTRTNTRKNKQGAFCVTVRLLKLAVDAASLPPVDDSTKELVVGKNIRWDEQLAYYQENPETIANQLAEAESLATPDELSMPDSTSKTKSKTSKSATPKIRRVRGLGTANGTPGKGLLAPASLLPEAVQEERQASQAQPQTQQLPKPKVSKIKKMPVAPTSIDSSVSSSTADTKLPALDVAPVGVQPTAQRKSRLAAPKKVMLPQPLSSIAAEGKENTQRLGLGDATPKKGIPAPKVIVPPAVGMESGLPRRRGRKY